jgi:hypothetical protein
MGAVKTRGECPPHGHSGQWRISASGIIEGRMTPFAATAIVIISFFAMEAIAWSAHKYIMHGWGWGWHRDHHERHDRMFEKNDLYALFGAGMSISAFAIGSPWSWARGRGRRARGLALAFFAMASFIR